MKILLLTFIQLLLIVAASAQNPTAKVYQSENGGNYYGKMYVPQGGKYKLMRNPKEGTSINLYYGNLDNTKIYVNQVVVIEDCYWIDATATSHTFIVSSTSADDVMMETVTETEDAMINDTPEYFYFNLALSRQNRFRYTEDTLSNEILRSNKTYSSKYIYVLDDSFSSGLTFTLLNPNDASAPELPANSLYVLGSKKADSLNVILEDAGVVDNPDGIKSVFQSKNVSNNLLYNLQGKIITNPQRGSVYIRNGRKYVAR